MRQVSLAIWVLAMIGNVPGAAQTVVRQPAPLDSTRASLRHDLVTLRDSLNTIDGAAARLHRDSRTASEASLLSRARLVREACARSSRTIPLARTAILEADLTTPQRAQRADEVVAALDSLQTALRHCETEFAAMSRPGQAERVRGYANDRVLRIQKALRYYDRQLRPFLGAMGIRILPLGVGSKASGR